MREVVERRILGAIRFLDATTRLAVAEPLAVAVERVQIVDPATGQPITPQPALAVEAVRLIRNRRGDYVIASAPGLEAHAEAFEHTPAAPPLASIALELTVSDPGRWYLPRRCTIRLPRDPDPSHADQEDSLFRLVDVALFPAPIAALAPGWAVVRAHVTEAVTLPLPAGQAPPPLAGALIRVVRAGDGERLAMGLSDQRGEALVAVPGIPVTTWGADEGPVLATEIPVTLEVVFDPAAGEIPDPDALEATRETLRTSSAPAALASGRVLVVALSVPLE